MTKTQIAKRKTQIKVAQVKLYCTLTYKKYDFEMNTYHKYFLERIRNSNKEQERNYDNTRMVPGISFKI